MSAVLLELTSLRKQYGTLRALDDVALRVVAGEFHGLIGPNGSGKSTLLKCIAGAEFASSGQVSLEGRDITGMPPALRARAGMSLKFQITAVLPDLTVYDNVLLALQAAAPIVSLVGSRTRRALDARVMETLARFRLDARPDVLAAELSHGQQQWLEIAMALAVRPRLLLLDEPTAGMSPQERRVTGALLEPIRGECALLIVEHDLDFIKDICDSLTVLDQGRVVASGSITAVTADPRVREAYMSHA